MQTAVTLNSLLTRICVMKIKDDIEWKWSNGWTIYDIADEYNTTPEAVLKLLGIEENPFSYELH